MEENKKNENEPTKQGDDSTPSPRLKLLVGRLIWVALFLCTYSLFMGLLKLPLWTFAPGVGISILIYFLEKWRRVFMWIIAGFVIVTFITLYCKMN